MSHEHYTREALRRLRKTIRDNRELRNRFPGDVSIRFSDASKIQVTFGGRRTRWITNRHGQMVFEQLDDAGKIVMSAVVDVARAEPPAAAEWLLGLFTTDETRDALLGDLEERFSADCQRFGQKFARRRYLMAAMRSAGPLMWSRLKRLGLFVMIYKAFGG